MCIINYYLITVNILLTRVVYKLSICLISLDQKFGSSRFIPIEFSGRRRNIHEGANHNLGVNKSSVRFQRPIPHNQIKVELSSCSPLGHTFSSTERTTVMINDCASICRLLIVPHGFIDWESGMLTT